MDTVVPLTVEQTTDLRRRILRSDDPNAEVIVLGDHEPGCFHLGILRDGVPVATATAFPCPSPDVPARSPWQLRFMAVEFDLQGTGLGGQVLEAVISAVADRGGDLLWANGRDTSLDFYRAMGFHIVQGSAHASPSTGLPHHRIWIAC
jgi:GNAT superfamily N-acetyltransferase